MADQSKEDRKGGGAGRGGQAVMHGHAHSPYFSILLASTVDPAGLLINGQ